MDGKNAIRDVAVPRVHDFVRSLPAHRQDTAPGPWQAWPATEGRADPTGPGCGVCAPGTHTVTPCEQGTVFAQGLDLEEAVASPALNPGGFLNQERLSWHCSVVG